MGTYVMRCCFYNQIEEGMQKATYDNNERFMNYIVTYYGKFSVYVDVKQRKINPTRKALQRLKKELYPRNCMFGVYRN